MTSSEMWVILDPRGLVLAVYDHENGASDYMSDVDPPDGVRPLRVPADHAQIERLRAYETGFVLDA
jgi:hypothetical protein